MEKITNYGPILIRRGPYKPANKKSSSKAGLTKENVAGSR